MNNKNKIKYFLFGILFIVLTTVDQITKQLVVSRMDLNRRYSVVNNIVSFEYLENRGVAFGIFSNKLSFITIITFAIIAVIIYCMIALEKAILSHPKYSKKFTLLQFIFVLLTSGAAGNAIDRIRLGYVIDFISVDFMTFPTFNVADCFVTVGAFVLFIIIMFFINDEEFNSIKKI